ncbi:MAG: hypothetical protein JWN08_1353, partial [Frankiales bacterium]|nr:hypothetical protein [Frankiales bacterium]
MATGLGKRLLNKLPGKAKSASPQPEVAA